MRGKLTANQARRLAAAVLGLQPGASTDEARRAYLRKAAETHPDVGGSATAFRQIQTAWAVWEELDARSVPLTTEPAAIVTGIEDRALRSTPHRSWGEQLRRNPSLGSLVDVAV